MKSKRLKTLRILAAVRQSWRCHYCSFPMWEGDPNAFIARYGISKREAIRFKCTAEHVKARCDGGEDSAANIVAACRTCNGLRHRRKNPRSADDHAVHVRKRLAGGRWLPAHLLAIFGKERRC